MLELEKAFSKFRTKDYNSRLVLNKIITRNKNVKKQIFQDITQCNDYSLFYLQRNIFYNDQEFKDRLVLVILNTIEDSDWYKAGKVNVEEFGLTKRPNNLDTITTIKGIPTPDFKLFILLILYSWNKFKRDTFFRLRDAILFHPEFIMRTRLGVELGLLENIMKRLDNDSEMFDLNKEFAIFLQERLVDHH